MIFFPYFSFRPNKNLLPQIDEIRGKFKNSDLILVDREASGDPFSMISGPLNFIFGKQAVYFINPGDLDKINQDNFTNVYFIIPDKNIDFYANSGILARLVPQNDYKIEISALNVIINPVIGRESEIILPRIENVATYGKIYLLKN